MDNENEYTGGLKREVMLRFRVTEAERDLIYEKMRLLNTNNLAAYMRKIAIDGYIINTDNSRFSRIISRYISNAPIFAASVPFLSGASSRICGEVKGMESVFPCC